MSNLAASSGTSLIQIPLLSQDAPYCFRSWSWQRTNDLVPDSSDAGVLFPLWSLSNGDTLCSTHRWLLSGRVIKDHLPPPFPISHNRLFILRATLPPSQTFILFAASTGFTLCIIVSVKSCSPKIQVLCYEHILICSMMVKDISGFSVCLELQDNVPGECG